MHLLFRRRRRIKPLPTGLVLALLLILWLTPSVRADDEIDLSYDIYNQENRFTVWVDLSPFIDAAAVSRLEEGIDYLVDCQVTLSIPRRFFGDRQVTRRSEARRIRYHSVTENFQVSGGTKPGDSTLSFLSVADLYQYFKDSIEIDLGSLDSLKSEERYVLDLDVTTISLTDLNLAPSADSTGNSESPLRFLFRQFLNLTDYGRNEYRTKSRPFSLGEIGPEL